MAVAAASRSSPRMSEATATAPKAMLRNTHSRSSAPVRQAQLDTAAPHLDEGDGLGVQKCNSGTRAVRRAHGRAAFMAVMLRNTHSRRIAQVRQASWAAAAPRHLDERQRATGYRLHRSCSKTVSILQTEQSTCLRQMRTISVLQQLHSETYMDMHMSICTCTCNMLWCMSMFMPMLTRTTSYTRRRRRRRGCAPSCTR